MKILAIEDDAITQAVLKAKLMGMAERGFAPQIEFARGLYIARPLLTRFVPDIILLDLDLCDSDADQTLSWIPEVAAKFPVVILSTVATRARVEQALLGGAQDFVDKEVLMKMPVTLVQAMDRALLRFGRDRVRDYAFIADSLWRIEQELVGVKL